MMSPWCGSKNHQPACLPSAQESSGWNKREETVPPSDFLQEPTWTFKRKKRTSEQVAHTGTRPSLLHLLQIHCFPRLTPQMLWTVGRKTIIRTTAHPVVMLLLISTCVSAVTAAVRRTCCAVKSDLQAPSCQSHPAPSVLLCIHRVCVDRLLASGQVSHLACLLANVKHTRMTTGTHPTEQKHTMKSLKLNHLEILWQGLSPGGFFFSHPTKSKRTTSPDPEFRLHHEIVSHWQNF